MSQIEDIYNAFDPEELPAGDPAYVNCQKVRGDWDIIKDLGKKILLAKKPTCLLYTGHRGVGKSTELLRLKDELQKAGYFVVYFAADEDIELADTEYTDILLACTRHVIQELRDKANPSPLINWLEQRWESLKALALTEVSLKKLTVEQQIDMFTKITAELRAVPSSRQEIRKQVDAYTPNLVSALNEFIEEAKNKLAEEAKNKLKKERHELVVIVDNLDRIDLKINEDGKNNHEQIFLERSKQMQGLKCHVIYTVPISMVYSGQNASIANNYPEPSQILPMIMVKTQEGNIHEPGIEKLKELIAKRLEKVDKGLSSKLDNDVFKDCETRKRLCIMSGGHVRILMRLMRTAIRQNDTLPITSEAVERAISEEQDIYCDPIHSEQWIALAKVSCSKKVQTDDLHQQLLLNRSIYSYRCLNVNKIIRWYDVNPLIKEIKDFQEALDSIK